MRHEDLFEDFVEANEKLLAEERARIQALGRGIKRKVAWGQYRRLKWLLEKQEIDMARELDRPYRDPTVCW